MKKRIIVYILFVLIIAAQTGCLRFFAEDKKICEVDVDYVYYLNQGTLDSGDFSLLNYKTSGFSFSNVPVDKSIIESDCPNYDIGLYRDVAIEISYGYITWSGSNQLHIRLVKKDIEGAPTWANYQEVYISGNFETGAAVIGEGEYDEQQIYCVFDFVNMQIHLIMTKELEYKIEYD